MAEMRAGRLRHRLELRKPVRTRTPSGDYTTSMELQDTVWGAAEGLRASERFASQTARSELDTRFRIRWRGDIAPDWEIVHRGHTYEITPPVDPTGRREELEILATVKDPESVDVD